jgi:hypothetical protein
MTATPVLDTIADLTATSATNNTLQPCEFMLARMAALIAVGAPPASYLANLTAAEETAMTAEDVQGVMIAVAPLVGTWGQQFHKNRIHFCGSRRYRHCLCDHPHRVIAIWRRRCL